MHILQQELDQIAIGWNNHPIRPSRARVVPAGTPEELFFIPIVAGMAIVACSC